jgi:ATP-dependent Lon protease
MHGAAVYREARDSYSKIAKMGAQIAFISTMEQMPPVLPVLPIRNAVIFPGVSMPLVVGRGRSIRAIEQSQAADNLLVVVTQQILTPGDPQIEDLYSVGTLCKMEGTTPTELGSRQIVVTGVARYRIVDFQLEESDFLAARGEIVADVYNLNDTRNQALFYNLKELAREVVELLPGATEPLIKLIDRVEDASYLCNVCAAYLNLPLSEKQELLETVHVTKRMETLLSAMRKERETLHMQREIREKMSERLNKAQREALLREQLRTIRSELGDEPGENLADEIEGKLREARLPEEASKHAS